ncbi:MAG: M48 family metallopeptidase [Desulfobacterales bacterium]|nr:M48 family metallopeptidase [Desulfobacterales bacterium]
MDFFKHQDIARAKTSRLIALFILAILAIAFAVYGIALIIMFYHYSRQPGANLYSFEMIQPELGFWVISATLLVILFGTIAKIIELAKGGRAIAEKQGGRLINTATTDAAERRLINVVEEMAIASGIPVPQVYILDEEKGINAFAAGYTPNDAAVAVTRGCLSELRRDELQGVIAHEFSHILSGDMRLNIRLIGLLSGIMVIAYVGRLMLQRRSGNNKHAGVVVVIALLLMLVGSLGFLFGRMIQAAVSRQREYFADASAVQFTRNPRGLSGALIKIGSLLHGSRIHSPHAQEICHMFIGSAFRSAFATHPPLRDRIQRLEPEYRSRIQQVLEKKPAVIAPKPAKEAVSAASAPITALAAGAGAVIQKPGNITEQNIRKGRKLIATIPHQIKTELNDILGAMAVTCMLLLDEDPQIRKRQLKRLQKHAPGKLIWHLTSLESHFKTLDLQLRLPILDLALPVLRQMSAGQYAKFKAFIQIMVEADARLSFFEFALQQIITHRLGANYQRHKKDIVYKNISALAADAATILSQLAHVGHPQQTAAQAAFNYGWKRLNITDSRWKMQPAGKVSFGALRVALKRFALASPGVKKIFLDACAHCVLHDERVTIEEAELVRAVAYALDIPLPPFLDPFSD